MPENNIQTICSALVTIAAIVSIVSLMLGRWPWQKD